jgi:hypothetical protein
MQLESDIRTRAVASVAVPGHQHRTHRAVFIRGRKFVVRNLLWRHADSIPPDPDALTRTPKVNLGNSWLLDELGTGADVLSA